MIKDASFFETARKRKAAAESYWSQIYNEFDVDAKYFADDQWEQSDIDARDNMGKPILTFNQVKQPVLRQINQLRQNKPAIHFSPEGYGATQETAEFYSGKVRNIEYASQADVARTHAAKCAAIGGIGFYRITSEYVDDESFEQDLYVRRILDPRAVLYDPNVELPDFSDAEWCFVKTRMRWEDYKAKYGDKSAIGWDAQDDRMKGWADEQYITLAEYWHIEKHPRTLVALTDGRIGLMEDFDTEELGEKEANVMQRRQVEQRVVHFDKINGVETLEETEWVGSETGIPILVVLGDEMIVEGKRILAGMIRSARDPQKLLNGYLSSEAEAIGLTNRVPYIGPKGTFKSDRNWKDANKTNPAFLEYDLVYDQNGQLVNVPPQRQAVEAAIQALSQAALQMTDGIKRAMGYQDDVLQPSKSDLSGIAINRRSLQQETANFHIADSLSLAMWREGNIYLEVIPKIHDTPKELQVSNEAGDTSTHYVTQEDEEGNVPLVPGHEDEPHHRLDQGTYLPRVTIGPSYADKIDEESDFLTQIIQGDPALMRAFLDVIFKMRGYPDLEARAKLVAPPAVQAALRGDQPIPPEVQAQIAQSQQQMQLLEAELQQLRFEKAAKTQELQAKHLTDVENNAVKIAIAEIQSKSKEAIDLVLHQMNAVKQQLEMWQEMAMQHHAAMVSQQQQQQEALQPPNSQQGGAENSAQQ